MNEISFIIVTCGTNDHNVQPIVDSIQNLNIPNFEIIIVGGQSTTLKGTNLVHVPFDETLKHRAWITKKKNLGVQHSKYDTVVIQHDYYIFDPDWYEEYVKFGEDWDICIPVTYHSAEQGSIRANGWRIHGRAPGYPELPECMCVPSDIDCFVPYMTLPGGLWIAKKWVMLAEPLNDNMVHGDPEDAEWSSRVVPGWMGKQDDNVRFRIVSNSKCVTRLTKFKPPYPGNPDWAGLEKHFEPLWDALRNGYRRPGVYHYDSKLGKVLLTK